MNRFTWKSILATMALSALFAAQIDGYCSKCVKIEEERDKEQKAHPQAWEYYDEAKQNQKEDQNSSAIPKERPVQMPLKNETMKSSSAGAINDSPFSSTIGNTIAYTNNSNEPRKHDFFNEEDALHESPSFRDNPNAAANNRGNIPRAEMPFSYSHSYSTIFTILRTKNFIHTIHNSFTLFVPTNEALKKLPAGTLEALSLPENAEKLASLVSNHVVPRKLLKNDFIEHNDLEIKAISGKNLTLNSQNGQLYVENIKILRSEPAGDDGVIYIIDQVILR